VIFSENRVSTSRDHALTREGYLGAAVCLSIKTPIGKCKLRQRVAFMIADDQGAVLKSPLAAGEELSRTATFRCDCALVRSRGASEIHEAPRGAHLAQPPASAEFNWRWRWWRRRRWRGGSFRWGLASGASGQRRKQEDDERRAHRCATAAPPWCLRTSHCVEQTRNCLSKSTSKTPPRSDRAHVSHFMVGMTNSAPCLIPDGQRAVTVLVLV